MRILHLADLHIGKVLNGYNLIEDHRFALKEVVNIVYKEGVECVMIAGDIYQNSNPSIEAIRLFENFIYELKERDLTVLITSGNHDSAERISIFADLIAKSNIFFSKPIGKPIEKVTLEDKYGKINFFLIPYIKPLLVKSIYPENEINDFSDAVKLILDSIEIDVNERNIAISHQFILNAVQSQSEEVYVGGSEAIPDFFYEKFDYTALGHIHKKQSFLNGKLRYPGALLKLDKAESNYDKTITILDIKEKGNIEVIEKKIEFLREMRVIKGDFQSILENSITDSNREDYIHIELSDQDEVVEAHQRLKVNYPNIMTFKYIDRIVHEDEDYSEIVVENKSAIELFEEFYKLRTENELSDTKREIILENIEQIWGEQWKFLT